MKLISNSMYSVLLVLFVGYLDAVKFRCDYSYNKVGWFKYHVIPATWHEARLRCIHEGAMLASPTTAEITAIMKESTRYVDIFTGIHSSFSKGNYRTIDGIPLNAIAHTWADNEPNNKNNAENCISLDSEGKFADVNCDEVRPFICYRPNSNVTANACGTIDPEYRLEPRTNKCYKFHTIAQTFERADFICSAEGGHLAIINSIKEADVLRKLFVRYPDKKIIGTSGTHIAFIGFVYWEGEWITLDGQSLETAGFSSFSEGEPNNSTTGELCGSIFRNGYLNDLWCDKPYAFICEKEPKHPAVCDSDDLSEDNTNKPIY